MAVGTRWNAYNTFPRKDGLTAGRQKRIKKTTPGSECALNALAIDNPLEYARLYLDGTMQMWKIGRAHV